LLTGCKHISANRDAVFRVIILGFPPVVCINLTQQLMSARRIGISHS